MSVACVGGLLDPSPLNAQARYEIAPGSLVRVTVPPSSHADGLVRIEGRLVRLDADSVVVTDDGHDHAVAMDQLLGIEPRSARGRGSGALRGLGWGGSISVLAGALLGWINPDDDPAGSALFDATVLGSLGGGIGAAIGAAWPGERWVEQPAIPPVGTEDGSQP
jgi:hypothetical protein